jgi:hypothetical protein
MRILMAILAVAVLSASAHAGPFSRRVTTTRATSCVGGACAKAVTTAPVRVVRKVVGR